MKLLTTYHDCMLAKFKENVQEAANLRQGFQEILEEGLQYGENACYRQSNFNDEGQEEFDTTNDHIVYDLASYLLHARSRILNCNACLETLETTKDKLPGDFLENALVDLRDRGGLKWATPNLFYTISAVEGILDQHFHKAEGYIKDSFEDVIAKLTKLKLPLICCTQHRSALVPKLIFEYVVIRFRFKARNRRNNLISKVTAQRHSNMKQSKLISTKVSLPSGPAISNLNAKNASEVPFVTNVDEQPIMVVDENPVASKTNVLCCNCPLIPAKIYTVTKEGDNQGRQFYGCDKPRELQCKFFKWVSETVGNTKVTKAVSKPRKRRNQVCSTAITPLSVDNIPAKKARKCGKCRQEGMRIL